MLVLCATALHILTYKTDSEPMETVGWSRLACELVAMVIEGDHTYLYSTASARVGLHFVHRSSLINSLNSLFTLCLKVLSFVWERCFCLLTGSRNRFVKLKAALVCSFVMCSICKFCCFLFLAFSKFPRKPRGF